MEYFSSAGVLLEERNWKEETTYANSLPLGINNANNLLIFAKDELLVLNENLESLYNAPYWSRQIIMDNNDNYYLESVGGMLKIGNHLDYQWEYSFDSEDSYLYQYTLDKNDLLLIVAGNSSSNSIEIYKLDSFGELEWLQVLNGYYVNQNASLVKTIDIDNDNALYLWFWEFEENGDYSLVLLKVSENGELEWEQHLLLHTNVLIDQDNERILVSGVCYNEDMSLSTCLSICTYDGEIVDVVNVSDISNMDTSVDDIEQDTQGNIIMLFYIDADSSEFSDLHTIYKLTEMGEIIWFKNFSSSAKDTENYRLHLDSEDNIIINGLSCNDYYDCRCVVFKFDPDGNLLWDRQMPQCYSHDLPCNAALDEDDNIYLAGYYGYADDDDDDEPGCGCF